MIVSYRRVSTDRQDIGLEAQQAAIDAWLSRGGETAIDFVEKRSGRDMKRPELQKAIAAVESARGILVVAKLDRLSRSVADFATLVDRANRRGWKIVVVDLNIDMTTPSGAMIANIMAALAQWERAMISIRIKEAAAVNRRRGIRPGRPVADPLAKRIVNMRATGYGIREIARIFNREAIPTAGGGKMWYASTVRSVLGRVA